MSLQGKVTGIEGVYAIVEVEPRPECTGCHACTGLLDGEKRSKRKQIKALVKDFEVNPGDDVLLDLNPGEGSIAALLIFGLPIAGFFAGLALTPWLCNSIGCGVSDLARVISGFTGMSVAFALLAVVARTRKAEQLSLKVVKILHNSTASEESMQTDTPDDSDQ
ncbi:MAG: SoxR reducing system RseC family protein [Candidatus Riflebacteria bacterium]|nr:SoxR reducing system RseC family protein [Candidatus Riflebacteria bacterium]